MGVRRASNSCALRAMLARLLPQGLSERLDGVEWNGDSSRQTEMEVGGWESVQGNSVGRKLSGFEIITELSEAGGKVL